jgi:carbamate kinase
VKVVVALGGNALLERGERPDSGIQEEHVASAVAALGPVLQQHDVIITHGNGPQVGVLALESASDSALSRPYPFDVLGAQTQGMIGYWVTQALSRAVPGKQAACLICRTIVAAGDPAFGNPSKFVGPVYDETTARRLAAAHGWQVRPDGAAWRRVVPSPEPAEIVELRLILTLAHDGVTVVCSGGGGIPVVRDDAGGLHGVEAVIDKDLSAALLARELGAGALLILTDVPAVEDDYGTPDARPIHCVTTSELRARTFPAGSMGPKVEAACRFADATGGMAAIGRLDDAQALLAGQTGTIITRKPRRPGQIPAFTICS